MKPALSPFSSEEEDAIAAEVQEDIDAGVGEKHFQELFDSLNSTQGDASVDVSPEVRDRLARFMLQFQAGLSDQLRGNEHGFVCLGVSADGHGTGFICSFRDKGNRPFNVAVSYDDGFQAAAKNGNAEMGRGMLTLVLDRLVAARKTWFARMGQLH
jgi:hypothetical protein